MPENVQHLPECLYEGRPHCLDVLGTSSLKSPHKAAAPVIDSTSSPNIPDDNDDDEGDYLASLWESYDGQNNPNNPNDVAPGTTQYCSGIDQRLTRVKQDDGAWTYHIDDCADVICVICVIY